MAILRLQTLIDADACASQVELFRTKFGDSVEITPELCESVANLFSWAWAARHLLSTSALAEYRRVVAPAWAGYERVVVPAWAEYERVMARAFAEAHINDQEQRPCVS